MWEEPDTIHHKSVKLSILKHHPILTVHKATPIKKKSKLQTNKATTKIINEVENEIFAFESDMTICC